MEARHLLKQLKDDDWYLGDTEGASRQYIHPEGRGVITVCVRFTDELGPETLAAATTPATAAAEHADQDLVIERTRTGVSAYSSALTGCVATSDTEDDVRARMAEATGLHLKRLRGRAGS
jgi:predicted RNA binding protein YcfA (HicA-like mRNA interferase family)